MDSDTSAEVYHINKEYRIVSLKGNKCSLFFKNKQNVLRATLDGCGKFISTISINGDKELNNVEKALLLTFVRAKNYALSKEAAEQLDISIIKYDDGREEYVSEKLLLRRLSAGINFAKVYIGKLKVYQLDIKDYTRNVSYNLSDAEIVKLNVGENCSVNIDLRDNDFIESLVIKDKFSGTLNLSRTSLESVFIGNNCRCNMTISDSQKCPNIQIADICSGNINIINSCLYALTIGYYSYADIMLSNNVIKKDIAIGDAFRGGIYATNQDCELVKVGNDFKGWMKLNNQNYNFGIKKLDLGDDFSGNINLSGDNSIQDIVCGIKFVGKIVASYATALNRVNIGRYFNGNIDVAASSVNEILVDYGASGRIAVKGCRNLKMLQASIDNDLYIDGDVKAVDAISDDKHINYYFEDIQFNWRRMPFYKRIYRSFTKRA